jgi:hypothetical protein
VSPLETVLSTHTERKVTRWILTYYIISALSLSPSITTMKNKLSNAMEKCNDSCSSWPAFCGLLSLFMLSFFPVYILFSERMLRKNYWVVKVYDHCQMHFVKNFFLFHVIMHKHGRFWPLEVKFFHCYIKPNPFHYIDRVMETIFRFLISMMEILTIDLNGVERNSFNSTRNIFISFLCIRI